MSAILIDDAPGSYRVVSWCLWQRGLGERKRDVKVTRRILIISFVSCVVLFVIAAPFGHDHHGVGLVLSDVFWTLFLVSVPVFIVLCLIASVSAVLGRRQASP